MSLHGFIRGGNWNNNDNTGVLTLNLNNSPDNSNNNIGFRVSRYNNSGPIFVNEVNESVPIYIRLFVPFFDRIIQVIYQRQIFF